MAAKQASMHPAASSSSQTELPEEGVRETADSIVVAFILAFVFRAFIIEAFVIPTGSMAATLYGKHGTMICGDCGWEFTYGLTDLASPNGRRSPLGANEVAVCPNCNHGNRITEINDTKRNAEAGDRILALKWPYDIGGDWLGPKRWDVALFKDPSDPELDDGVTNFIKRMVGLPNEVLEIIDGDVYAVPVEDLSEPTLQALDDARHAKYLRRCSASSRNATAQQIEDTLRQGWNNVLEELSEKLRLCRKTALAQQALWIVLYDHDYPPRSLDRGQPYWTRIDPDSAGWNTGGRKLQFRASGERYEGLALRGKKATDRVGYNIHDGGEVSGVTDLRLRFVFARTGGEGALLLKLPKRERSCWAELSSDGALRLYETGGEQPFDEEPLAARTLPPFEVGQPVVVDFQDVDYRVSLTINGEELLATTPEQFSPDIAALRLMATGVDPGEIEIFAGGMSVELGHVVTERDVYYRSPRRAIGGRLPALSGVAGTVWGVTGNPILLREGEYFMLGDNSPASGDSRLWNHVGPHLADRGEAYQLGTVAADQLIGRAFFVYWPSGHRSAFIPLLDRFGLIPNVGRMRWIR